MNDNEPQNPALEVADETDSASSGKPDRKGKALNVMLDASDHEAVQRAATERGMSMKDFVVTCAHNPPGVAAVFGSGLRKPSILPKLEAELHRRIDTRASGADIANMVQAIQAQSRLEGDSYYAMLMPGPVLAGYEAAKRHVLGILMDYARQSMDRTMNADVRENRLNELYQRIAKEMDAEAHRAWDQSESERHIRMRDRRSIRSASGG